MLIPEYQPSDFVGPPAPGKMWHQVDYLLHRKLWKSVRYYCITPERAAQLCLQKNPNTMAVFVPATRRTYTRESPPFP